LSVGKNKVLPSVKTFYLALKKLSQSHHLEIPVFQLFILVASMLGFENRQPVLFKTFLEWYILSLKQESP
jgi:hypothetical protein